MTILHLEDCENDAVLVEALLRHEWPQCRIHRVASRAEFESALEFQDFDLVLSDYQMPGFDGLHALEKVRVQRPGKPFIFMSGTIGEERAIDAMKHGADDYVIKDRPARLVPAVRQALARVEESVRRRRVEEALRQNQERFRQITENVADMIAVLDVEGRAVYSNPAYRRLLGKLGETRGASVFEQIHPEDRERVREAFAATVRTGSGERIDYRFLQPDGSVHFIESQASVLRDAEGAIVNVLVVSRDITARRAAEQQLREQASLLDKARDAIIATDLEHRITYWNASAERIYGWSAAEVMGRDLRALGLQLDARRFAAAHEQMMSKGEWHGTLQCHARHGAKVHVATTWSLVRDAAGQPARVLLIDTDITEAKQLETQLLRAQRTETIGTLTSGIAHDLNNVLAPILLGADLLRMEELLPPALRIVDSIEASAQHGAALVRQLLGFARGTEGERMEVQPKRLLAELVNLLRQTLPPRITPRLELAETLSPILADPTQLKQLIINLCINARDAMPATGTILITAEEVVLDEDAARALHEGQPGRYLHLRVADTGSGIPPEILDRIFDPFFTTKEAGKGTGLGLSMVRGIVKGHQGFLHVESAPGVGTTFHIYLPALHPAARAATPAPATTLAQGRGEAILIVDDDAAVRDLLRPFLEQHGYRVLGALDRATGFIELRRRLGEVGAVITSATRRGDSGESALAMLREIAPATPAIVSTSDIAQTRVSAGNVSAHATIAKPIDPMELLAVLRRVLDAANGASSAGGAAHDDVEFL